MFYVLGWATRVALACCLLVPVAQAADVYPSRPVKVIVHTLPGAASDIHTRIMADALGKQLGQAFVVENRAGAGGTIGAEAVTKGPADGYTLLGGASSVIVMLPAVSKRKLPYDPDVDLIPIGRIAKFPFVLVVNANSPYKSLADVVAAAKEKPGTLSYGSAGGGTNPHMLGEMLSQLGKVNLVHVPYKGPAAAQTDLLGGQIDMQFDTLSAVKAQIQAGKLRALVVTGKKRLPAIANVPTAEEAGYGQLYLEGWSGLYAPKGTPPAVVDKLRAAFAVVVKTPALAAALSFSGDEPDGTMGDDMLRDAQTNRQRWRELAVNRNIAVD